jgi:methyl halide transferase
MTDWEERYRKGDTPWEKGRAAPPLIELLEKTGREIWGKGSVLVPGCGTGHDVRVLAARGLTVLGVDLAETAIARARHHPAAGDESYELADFLDPGWSKDKSFSAIWEHTCFCAIDPGQRPDYAQACADLLEPGGHLIGVFFLTPNEPGEEDKGPPFNTSVEELDRHFSPWFERQDAWVPTQSYPEREGREWIGIYRRME